MSILNIVRVQHANDTDRWHPAWYSCRPFPGPGPDTVMRYQSRGHHTEGFDSLDAARENLTELAAQVDATIPADRELVVEMAEAGPDMQLVRLPA